MSALGLPWVTGVLEGTLFDVREGTREPRLRVDATVCIPCSHCSINDVISVSSRLLKSTAKAESAGYNAQKAESDMVYTFEPGISFRLFRSIRA